MQGYSHLTKSVLNNLVYLRREGGILYVVDT